MVALFILCLALLFPATVARAADTTNAPASATSQKDPPDIEGSPEWVKMKLANCDTPPVMELGVNYLAGRGVPLDGKKAVGLFAGVLACDDPQAEFYLGIAF